MTKPFNGKTMKEYVLKFSETSRLKTVDPLYTLTWIQTRPRFKLLNLIDLEGRITESNVIFLIANLSFYPFLSLIRLENGTTQFDMEYVQNHVRVSEKGIFDKNVKIEEKWVS